MDKKINKCFCCKKVKEVIEIRYKTYKDLTSNGTEVLASDARLVCKDCNHVK